MNLLLTPFPPGLFDADTFQTLCLETWKLFNGNKCARHKQSMLSVRLNQIRTATTCRMIDSGFACKMYAKQNTWTPCSVHGQLI